MWSLTALQSWKEALNEEMSRLCSVLTGRFGFLSNSFELSRKQSAGLTWMTLPCLLHMEVGWEEGMAKA